MQFLSICRRAVSQPGRSKSRRFVGICTLFGAILAAGLALGTIAARAAEPIYPPGGRIGLVPLKGLVLAKTFNGFEDAGQEVKVALSELPPSAYVAVERAMFNSIHSSLPPRLIEIGDGLAFMTWEDDVANGVAVRRWGLLTTTPNFVALIFMQVPKTAQSVYDDATVRALLTTIATRADVPAEEQLALMPFKITDRADFKALHAVARQSLVILSDPAPPNSTQTMPYVLISARPEGPSRIEERAGFAEEVVSGLKGIANIRLISSEPLRIGGQAGHEVKIEAIYTASKARMKMIVWLRFGSGGYLAIIAGATPDDWQKAYPRFRAVRDGIEPR